MELVEGQTLADAIPAGGLRSPSFLELAVPIADAISSAHAKGIVHRDLKPANIMLDADGRVKVLDFGLAKLTEELSRGRRDRRPRRDRTAVGQLLGTVAYMSPEQAEGRTVDHRSDIFSLGIVLYQMATGRHPFQRDQQRLDPVGDPQGPPSRRRSSRSTTRCPGLGAIIARCLDDGPPTTGIHRRPSCGTTSRELQAQVTSGIPVAPAQPARARRGPAAARGSRCR